MSGKIWQETREAMVEGFTDIVNLAADLIAAPIMAVCRVTSDFIHGEGKYKHSRHDSRTPDRDAP